MNRENLLRVADAIEKHEIADLGFNMKEFVSNQRYDESGHGCKTTACIAGWTAGVFHPRSTWLGLGPEVHDAKAVWNVHGILMTASRDLGLRSSEAHALFYGAPRDVRFTEVTPTMAVATLRYAAEFGIVDWDAAQSWTPT